MPGQYTVELARRRILLAPWFAEWRDSRTILRNVAGMTILRILSSAESMSVFSVGSVSAVDWARNTERSGDG